MNSQKQNTPATSRSLPIALLRAREAVMAPIRPVLAAAGVTEAQWRVLRVIQEHGRLDPAKTAREACVLLPSLTRIIRDLEKMDLLKKTPHETDGRTFWLSVTDQADQLIGNHLEQSGRIFDAMQAEFGAERTEQLLDLLSELAELELP